MEVSMNSIRRAKLERSKNYMDVSNVGMEYSIDNLHTPKPTFKFDEINYTPIGVKKFEKRDLRREYTRIRGIVKKRAKRLYEAGYTDSYVIDAANNVPTLTDIGYDDDILYNEFLKLVDLYKDPNASLTAYRNAEKEIDFLREQLDIPLSVDSDLVGEFWRTARALLDVNVIGSPRIKQLIDEAMENHADDEKYLRELLSEVIINAMR